MANTVRLNLVMPAQTSARIETLRANTGAMSKADVVKDALRLYEVIVSDVLAGKEILSKDKDGNLVTYRIFIADAQKQSEAVNSAPRRPHTQHSMVAVNT